MIVVKLLGGLGNKMFQYALYQNILSSGKEALIDDFSFIPSWNFEIVKFKEIFPNISYNAASIDLVEEFAGKNTFVNKVRRRLSFLSKKEFVRERLMNYNPNINKLEGDYYLSGLWQSEKYFYDYKDIIKSTFMFKEFTDERNVLLSKNMSEQESIAIHIRKGADYEKKIIRGTCDINYYKSAIECIQSKIGNPQFYIFTDNKKWVNENIRDINYTLVDWNPVSGAENYLDMQLMSCCKHNIIANSTYSWWGAWLNSNRDKVIIGPKKWYNSKSPYFNTNDLIPENWIRL